jgi:hypothetical protein
MTTKRPLRRLQHTPALRLEDLDTALRQLRADMRDAAERLAESTRREGDEAAEALDVPDLSTRAEAALRALLEEDTLALIEPQGPTGIAAHELTHEWQKKALVGLKRDTLSQLAASRGLVPSAKLDELAQQVAASYQWDEQAIARLVLDYAEDPRVTEGGPQSRLFVLDQPVDLDWTAKRLSYVDGRYYRTDIAKWFTFARLQRTASSLRIFGSLQTYKVGVSDVDEERLIPERGEYDAQLDVHAGSQIAVVHRAENATVARSVMAAFKVATLANTLKYVPNTGTDADVRARSLHPTTEWLLDLVTYRLRSHLFRNKNAVLARFRLAKHEGSAEPQTRKLSLRAVRFEGENLMASSAASSLMWTEGRPLVDLTIMVTATASESDRTIRGSVPVRIAVERDHVLVSTGLSSDVTLTNEVHRAAVGQVELSILNAVDVGRSARLERTVRNQAENPDPEAEDVLLSDDQEVI